MKRIAILIGVSTVGWFAPCVQAQTLLVPKPLKPFSSETNYMSVTGYLRWRNYLESGNWACRGLVKFSERYADDQEGGDDAVSGMDINSVTPDKVNYSLRVNGSAFVNLPYKVNAVRPKGIFGDAIRIDFETTFCIGPDYHYFLTQFVAQNGLLDKVGNTFDFENGQRTQTYYFYLEQGQDGNVWVVDEVSRKRIQARYEQGIFYLPRLTPLTEKRK